MQIVVSCDLRVAFGATRDQGSRPTCVAFAISDAHAALRDGWVPLSCEYLFYHAVKRSGGGPSDGTTVTAALAAVRDDGQPTETVWPHLTELPKDLLEWIPPAGPLELFRRNSIGLTGGLESIFARLNAGQPLILGMMLSKAFFRPAPGSVIDAEEPPIPAMRHAVIAVEHGTTSDKRFILIRNSWGEEWGDAGYAWVSERYLAPRLINVAELTEDLTNGDSY